jgi:hypothetical protein
MYYISNVTRVHVHSRVYVYVYIYIYIYAERKKAVKKDNNWYWLEKYQRIKKGWSWG